MTDNAADNSSTAAQPVIVLCNLQKHYFTDAGEVQAVRGVDLEINKGDFVAIMGASGSGKSTLMNILGCLDQPTGGSFHLDGVDVGSLTSNQLADLRSRKLGFVFQGFNLLSRTTATENVELPLVYATSNLSAYDRHLQSEEKLQRVGLGERMDHFPNELSGGQQQRVAIARALVNKPTLLLADEPTGNLDSSTSEEIMALFRQLNEEGITIIMVTHEDDVAAHARRTVIMRDGQIKSDVRREPVAAVSGSRLENGHRSLFGIIGLGFNILSSSGRALLRNKLRTFLTALGMIIGVGAVIAMIAMGRGATVSQENLIRTSMGENLLLVISGQMFSGGMSRGFNAFGTLTLNDLHTIQHEVSGVVAVSPDIRSNERLVSSGKNWVGSVKGVAPEFFDIREWPMQQGSMFTQDDVDDMNTVALVGQTVIDRMFQEDPDVVGKTLRIGGLPFRIIGILSRKGAGGRGEDQDDVVMIPYTTCMKRVIGTKWIRVMHIKIASQDQLPVAKAQCQQILRDLHNIDKPEQDDFFVLSQDEIIQMTTKMTRTMTLLVGGIAAVSLLVGGIGIMNIMLVSVTERTREIGIRRAVGARASDVLLQFLVEAVVLSIMGGLIGIAVGVASAQIISYYFDWPVMISPTSIFISFGVSCLVGIIFGFFPALKASGLNPIEALRHE